MCAASFSRASRTCGPLNPERRRVLDDAGHAFERARDELEHEEGFARAFERRLDAAFVRGSEAEARVVLGVPQHDDDSEPEPSGLVETVPNERRTDASALVLREDGHGSEREPGAARVPAANPQPRQEDVPDDLASDLGDERELREESLGRSELPNETRLVLTTEGEAVNALDGASVRFRLDAKEGRRRHHRDSPR